MKRPALLFSIPFLILIAAQAAAQASITGAESSLAMTMVDESRQRDIPVTLYVPQGEKACEPGCACPVALISSGYGVPHTEYSFIAHALAKKGYMVVAIQHELPNDPPLATHGEPIITRMPNWSRGVANLQFVLEYLGTRYPQFDWNNLVLIGHSNGGDISALFAGQSPSLVSSLVTIDNRRMPLPRNHAVRVLSIRGSDFEADAGVLPTASEQRQFGIVVVKLEAARHNDMYDAGSETLKADIVQHIVSFLR